MRLATLDNSTRDGALLVVSSDGQRYLSASDVAPTLQSALDSWNVAKPALEALSRRVSRQEEGKPLLTRRLLAPLPRAYEWIDGSAYLHHIRLSRRARGARPPATLTTEPLAYQGGSGVLLGARANIVLPDPKWDLDLEGEICAIVSDVPRGISPQEALSTIRLLVVANDLTYRALVPEELAKGFGFLHSKPATAFSPFCVTPESLGTDFQEGRLNVTVHCSINGKEFGCAQAGPEMHFSFGELIANAARTRSLTAGTLIGGGTVSNAAASTGACCLVEMRAQEILDGGSPITPYLQPGDQLRIEALTPDGNSPFGAIEQRVVGP